MKLPAIEIHAADNRQRLKVHFLYAEEFAQYLTAHNVRVYSIINNGRQSEIETDNTLKHSLLYHYRNFFIQNYLFV